MKVVLASLLALSLFGCGNTAAGMKEDSSDNAQKAADSTNNVMTGAKEAGKAFGAATTLTPKIKLAMESDNLLNKPENLIDIDSTDDVVTLTGHITTSSLKERATEVAAKAISDAKATQKVENKLVVHQK